VGHLGLLTGLTEWILSLPPWLVVTLVFLFPALEASAFVGFVVPGEVAVILGGVVAYQGRAPLWAIIVAGVSGAIVGDSVGYLIGRRWGSRLLKGSIGHLPIIRRHIDEHLESARAYVRRRKGGAVFFGRFTAALRVLVPGLAGMSDVHYPTFAAYNVASGVLWGSLFAALGYVAGASYQRVEKIAGRIGLLLLALIVMGLVASRASRRLPSIRALADRVANTRVLSRIRGRYSRQVAWVRARLDPARPRGFALTFTIAVGALAAWAFAGLTQDVLGHDEVALLDPRVTRWIVAHRAGWLTVCMKTVTWLGSDAVIVPVLVLVGLALLVRRRDWIAGARLAAALAGAISLYDIVKAAVGRTRPPPAIWIGHFTGGAFPSGHATQAVAFYGMLALVLSEGRARRTGAWLWFGAALIALAVGGSRVYLGAHWFSDVLGGYALGATWLAIVVAVTLLASRPRSDRELKQWTLGAPGRKAA
jgi:membrane protein DedA with SNARE-associated domain/membrane-associated phospholipid phosphatase